MRELLTVLALATGGFALLAALVLVLRPRRPGYSLRIMVEMERDREPRPEPGPDERSDP